MKHLYFCRHGLSVLGQDGLWAGSVDTPLTAEGRKQAKLAGHEAKGLKIDYILCSPLSRARDTARIVAEEIGYPVDKLDVNNLVVERHFGAMEGKPWAPDFDMDVVSDAEPLDSILERARLTLKHLETIDADTILVVSHGSFGRALRHILNPGVPFMKTERFENAKVVKLI